MSSSESDRILGKLEDNSEKIRSYGVRELRLFGSYVTGEQRGESDIDILVKFEEGRGLFDDYTGLKRFLEDLFDKDVDLVKEKNLREELKENVEVNNIAAEL